MVEKTKHVQVLQKAGPIESVLKKMRIDHVAQASVLSIAMDQFTCTVLLDVGTCFRAWGYWMLQKEMHCKKKARVCNATDSTDDASDDTGRLKICVGGG